mgnify:FL=1
MTIENLAYIRRWRNNNRDKVREQARKYAKRNYEKRRDWLLVQREFYNIMISDYIGETRGRKRKDPIT